MRRLRQPGFAQKSSFVTSSVTPTITWPTSRKSHRLVRFKRDLRRISGSNAVLSLFATVLGLGVIADSESQDSTVWDQNVLLMAGVCLASLLQVSLIISYWTVRLRYREQVRTMLHTDEMPVARLSKSRASMCYCAFECAFHLLVLFPKFGLSASVDFFGMKSEIATYDLIFLTILLRNYHSVEYCYWLAEFSGVRTRFYSELMCLPARATFVAKCCLRRFGVKTALISYTGIVTVFSSSLYVFAYRTEDEFLESLQDSLFTVVMSVARTNPQAQIQMTLFGNVIVLASAFFGCFWLGTVVSVLRYDWKLTQNQAELCAEMMEMSDRARHRGEAAALIQRWWRYVRMRNKRSTECRMRLCDYRSQIRDYKAVRIHSQNEQSTCLRKQLKAIELQTSKLVTYMTTSSRTISAAKNKVTTTQLLQITRLEYRFYIQCVQISRFTGAPKPRAPPKSKRPQMKKRYRRLSTISEEDFDVASRASSPRRSCTGNPHEVKRFLQMTEELQMELERNET